MSTSTIPSTTLVNWNLVAPAPAELVQYAEDVVANQRPYDGDDRRTEVRRSMAINVFSQPVGEDLLPQGKPFVAVTRDISTSGLAMFHVARVTTKLLVVEFDDFAGGYCRMLLEVLRCNPAGRYFEIAGKLVSRLEN